MMVIIVPVIPSSSVRASSGVPWNASGDRGPALTNDSAAPTASAASTDSPGSTHSDPRTYSRSAPRLTLPTSTIRLRFWPQPDTLAASRRGPATSVMLVAEPGRFQVQPALQPQAGGLADGPVVVQPGEFGVLGGVQR